MTRIWSWAWTPTWIPIPRRSAMPAAGCGRSCRSPPRRRVWQLLAWAGAAAAGRPVAWAIEGTRHYGLGLARYLASHGQQVAEIDATRHVGKRRAGKSDPIDAVRAARELLARPHPARCAPTATARRCGC